MTINDFKKNVSIMEFISYRKDLDFIIKKDGKNFKCFIPARDEEKKIIYEENKPKKLDQIIVARVGSNNIEGSGQIEYFFRSNEFEKNKSNTIIDFVKDFVLQKGVHPKAQMRMILGALTEYVKSDAYKPMNESSFVFANTNPASKRKTNKKIDYTPPTTKAFDYLKSRGLSIDAQKFFGTFGTYSDDNKNIHEKVGFPYLKNSKIQTVQWIDFDSNLMQHKEKYFAADIDKNDSLWNSNYSKANNTIVLTESPEKAMAHFQSYKNDLTRDKIDPYYLSAGGNLTTSNIEHIQSESKRLDIPTKILAFDNDKAGISYGIKFVLAENQNESKIERSLEKDKIVLISENPAELQKASKLFTNTKIESGKLIFDTNVSKIKDTKTIITHFSEHLDDLKNKTVTPKRFKNNQNLI